MLKSRKVERERDQKDHVPGKQDHVHFFQVINQWILQRDSSEIQIEIHHP